MKSHVSDLTELAERIYKDATAKCTALRQEQRDLDTLRSRVKHEGLSFFTITLPDLGKDFEQALALGQIGPTHFRSFRKYGKIPAFLRGFFGLVFDKASGRIHLEPEIPAIEGLRQLCLAFKKLEVSCSPRRVAAALQEFKDCEHAISEPVDPDDLLYFSEVADRLWSNLVSSDNLAPYGTIPRHGPGATAEKLTGNSKFLSTKWHERLEPYFPLLHTRFPNENAYGSEEFQSVTLVLEDEEQPVRVTPVPKTLKGPRIIAIEPVCMQYAQQAISKALVSAIEGSWIAGGHVCFTDQSVNQKLAMSASVTGRYATIDLSSASDRVINSVASYMFVSNPDLLGAIQACRSKRAQTPDGEVIPLLKFASMGSALCFPVEAMYFYTICVAALLRRRNLPTTTWNCFKVSRDVYVYGDDIIVPVDDAEIVVEYLQKYHCKVNVRKSFWTGRFRESCGTDAYAGEEVTPTYIRQLPPDNKREIRALIGWVKTANQFYGKGYWSTSDYLVKRVEAILGELPVVGPKCAGLGKVSFQHLVSSERWNKAYQRFEVKAWTAVPVYRTDKLDGYGALLKCLLRLENGGDIPIEIAADHLDRTARYGAVALKRRWTQPY